MIEFLINFAIDFAMALGAMYGFCVVMALTEKD
jgi:hypothetical protein